MNSYLHVLNRLCEEVQENMADKGKDEIEWTVKVEILLFYAMIGLKPVGVNRHFMMACIHNRFSNYLNRQITSKPIWEHLDSMYDMAALHESEIIPFPNEEREFELPEDEFADLIKERIGQSAKTESDADVKKEESGTKSGKKTFAKPRPVQPPNQSKESAAKSPAVTPVSVKVNKAQVSVKAEPTGSSSSASGESTKIKAKPDVQQSKTIKTKASTSATMAKAPKMETSSNSQVKVQPADNASQKTKMQTSSPTKKPLKQEKEKNDTSEVKKTKESAMADKRKSSSVKEIPFRRRKDSLTKKNSDGQSPKPGKSDRSPAGTPTKNVKFERDDPESSTKSSRSQMKNESSDKKTRRSKADESPARKTTPTLKRRRMN